MTEKHKFHHMDISFRNGIGEGTGGDFQKHMITDDGTWLYSIISETNIDSMIGKHILHSFLQKFKTSTVSEEIDGNCVLRGKGCYVLCGQAVKLLRKE